MALSDRTARAAYHAGYWKKYFADPVKRARHMTHVRLTDMRRKQRIRRWIDEFKLTHGCNVCGFNEHPAALDFAHRERGTKDLDVGTAINSWSLKRVQAEVAKCDVLCANHHRMATFTENQSLFASAREARQRAMEKEVAGRLKRKPVVSCKHGHPFDESNTRTNKDGTRGCRECDRLKHVRHRRAKLGVVA